MRVAVYVPHRFAIIFGVVKHGSAKGEFLLLVYKFSQYVTFKFTDRKFGGKSDVR